MRIFPDPLNVLDSGCPADGVGDDAGPILGWLASRIGGEARRRLLFPSGHVFRMESTLDFTGIDGLAVESHGAQILNRSGANLFGAEGVKNLDLRGGSYRGSAPNDGIQDPTDVFIRFEAGSTRLTAHDLDLFEIRGVAFDDTTEADAGTQPSNTKDGLTFLDGIRFTDVRSGYNSFGGGSSQVSASNIHMLRGSSCLKFDGQQVDTPVGSFEGSRGMVVNNVTCREMFSNEGETGCIQLEENVFGASISNIVGDDLGPEVALIRVTAGQTNQPVSGIVVNGFSAKNVDNTIGGVAVGQPMAILARDVSGVRFSNGYLEGCGVFADNSQIDMANSTVVGSKVHGGPNSTAFLSGMRFVHDGQPEALLFGATARCYDTGCFFDSNLPAEFNGTGARTSMASQTF